MADVTTQSRDINALLPNAQRACRLFMQRCAERGLDVFITETYRSQERQDYLYSLGRTREGNKVTWTKRSRHTSRRAWDIACRGGDLYNTAVLTACGKVAAELGITWGGTWSTPDTPHFEVEENWSYGGKEDEPMTETEKAKMKAIDDSLTNLYSIVGEQKATVNELIEEIRQRDAVYNTVDEVPEWGRAAVQRLIDAGKLSGTGDGLALSADMVRLIVMLG